MTTEGIFTVRVAPEKQQQLDAIAHTLDRSRNWVVGEAINQYLEVQAWQIEQIQLGLEEEERGDVVPHDIVLAEASAKIRQARPVQ